MEEDEDIDEVEVIEECPKKPTASEFRSGADRYGGKTCSLSSRAHGEES